MSQSILLLHINHYIKIHLILTGFSLRRKFKVQQNLDLTLFDLHIHIFSFLYFLVNINQTYLGRFDHFGLI